MRVWLLAMLLALGIARTLPAQTQPLLQLQGQPYFGGSMTLHLTGAVGQPALLAYGLNPLTTPLQTGKGPWYVGSLVNLVALGSIPSGGRIDLPFTMPPLMPALAGIPVVMQGYVPFALSNPAVLPLDMPSLVPTLAQVIACPNPTAVSLFGRRIATGDLNGDGHRDIIGAASHEDYLGIESSGRVYVLWGPDFSTSIALASASPRENGFFGISVTVARLDADGLDDLIVGETDGDPPAPGVTGNLYIYSGSTNFRGAPSLVIPSPGTGVVFTGFGHAVATGDFNDDGTTDIAVSINAATVQGLTKAGRIDVILGPGFGTTIQILAPEPETNQGFGSSILAADVNGDGVDDLVESSPGADVGGTTNVGNAHVFIGPALDLLVAIPCPEPLGDLTDFGISVGAGDLNQDGSAEVLLSDRRNRVFIFWSPGFLSYSIIRKPPATFQIGLFQSEYGTVVDAADINMDGITDVLISDATDGTASGCSISGGGMVYVVLGPQLSTFHRVTDNSPACSNWFGEWAEAADLDGDGAPELLVGSSSADDFGIPNSGHITVLEGAVIVGS